MRIAGLILVAVVAAVALPAETVSRAASQQQKPDAAWTAMVGSLETAALAGRVDDVRRSRVDLLRMMATEPSGPRTPLIRYTIAYAGWRIAFAPSVPGAEQVLMLEDAVTQLNTVMKAAPGDAEAMTLLGAVYGARIGKSPELGMTLGPQSDQLINRAMRLAPSNPRALTVAGQAALHTPPEYGGSVSRAESLFRAALKAFDSTGPNAAWPNWGRFDAHVWLGQLLADKGDKTGARAEYEKALGMAPDSAWVRFSLLPAVK